MNLVERLKELLEKPIPTDGLDKIALDFEIQKAAREAMPRLLAVVEAADRVDESVNRRGGPVWTDNNPAPLPLGEAIRNLSHALQSLNDASIESGPGGTWP